MFFSVSTARGNRAHVYLPDVHALDETLFNCINMLNHLVCKNSSGQVPNHLVNIDHRSTLFVICKPCWLDARIDQCELAPPVFADAAAPMHATALHPVRPVHIGIHHCQNCVDVPSVEFRVNRCQ